MRPTELTWNARPAMQTKTTVPKPSARLQLETLFVLDDLGRIRSTREPRPTPGPAFILIRGQEDVTWAVHAGVADDIAAKVVALARQEPAATTWGRPPVHAEQYQALVGARIGGGPSYCFPAAPTESEVLPEVQDEAVLQKHFRGWTAGEITEGAGPMRAVTADGAPVSICFCARRSTNAAEAGLETAAGYRGRGFAGRAVLAWAASVRASGRVPLYSTSWANTASQRVAAKLGLIQYAVTFSIDTGAA